MIINRITLDELTSQIKGLKQPQCLGRRIVFPLAGHWITVESDLKKNCFNLEWKIIEIK